MNTTTSNKIHRLAVFVDIENVAGYCADLGIAVEISPVLDHLTSQFGRPLIKRSYGDISALPRPFQPYEIRRMLQQSQFEHIDIPHRPSNYSKNSADIKLVVDAVALIHSRPASTAITAIAVFSADRDFIPLFNHAREHGIEVIGCGPSRDGVSEDYINACDIFLFHDDFVQSPVRFVEQPPFSYSQENESAQESIVLPSCQTSDVDRLLAAIQSVQDDGLRSMAAQVAGRMRKLFPNYDVKTQFGSFKQFCLEQEKTGRIKLLDPELDAFEICAIPNHEVRRVDISNMEAGGHPTDDNKIHNLDSRTLLYQYHQWVIKKIKMVMPTPAVRKQLYESLENILQNRQNLADVLTLSDVAKLVTSDGSQETTNVAFRVFYGLYRARVLKCELTDNPFNPIVIGLAIPQHDLDTYFMGNMLKSFQYSDSGLPFDETVWHELMFGNMPLTDTLPGNSPYLNRD